MVVVQWSPFQESTTVATKCIHTTKTQLIFADSYSLRRTHSDSGAAAAAAAIKVPRRSGKSASARVAVIILLIGVKRQVPKAGKEGEREGLELSQCAERHSSVGLCSRSLQVPFSQSSKW